MTNRNRKPSLALLIAEAAVQIRSKAWFAARDTKSLRRKACLGGRGIDRGVLVMLPIMMLASRQSGLSEAVGVRIQWLQPFELHAFAWAFVSFVLTKHSLGLTTLLRVF